MTEMSNSTGVMSNDGVYIVVGTFVLIGLAIVSCYVVYFLYRSLRPLPPTPVSEEEEDAPPLTVVDSETFVTDDFEPLRSIDTTEHQ